MPFRPTLPAAALAVCAALALASPAAAAVSEAAHRAILTALDDEYHARTTCAEIIRRHGADRPFANIMRADEQHAALLIDLLRRNGLPVPANPNATGRTPLRDFAASAAAACTAGVAAEIENIRLYDEELLPAVAAEPEVARLLLALRNASANGTRPPSSAAPQGRAAVHRARPELGPRPPHGPRRRGRLTAAAPTRALRKPPGLRYRPGA